MRADKIRMTSSAWRMCIVWLMLAILAISTAYADKSITNIQIAKKADRVVISLTGDYPLNYSLIKSTMGKYLCFQFAGTIQPNGKVVGIKSGKIYNVRYSVFQPNPPISRIVINTVSAVDFTPKWSNNKKNLEITIWKNGKAPKEDNTLAEPSMAEPIFAKQTPKIVQPKPVVKKVAEPVVKVAGISETSPTPEPVDDNFVVKNKAIPSAAIIDVDASTGKPTGNIGVVVPLNALYKKSEPEPKPIVEKKISLNFLNADINDVLKALSQQSGKNIVASKEVTGNITVSLNAVSVEEALDFVSRLSGYTYTVINGTYLVGSKDTVKSMTGGASQDSVTEMIKLSYAKADDVISLVKLKYPDVQMSKIGVELTGRVGIDTKAGEPSIALRNSLIVIIGPPASVNGVKQLIQKFEDTLQMQTVETARETYKIKYVNANELATTVASLVQGIAIAFAPTEGFTLMAPKSVTVGDTGSQIELNQSPTDTIQKEQSSGQGAENSEGLFGKNGSSAGIQSRVASTEARTRPQALIIAGRAEDVAKAMLICEELDVRSPQIKIEAKITSITRSGEEKLGINWEWSSLTYNENDKRHFVRDNLSFKATLDALITSGDIDILATPSLSVLEGKPGVFFVGDDVTYIKLIDKTTNGTIVQTDSKQVGIQLRVVGDVSPDGNITLNLHPEVSTLKLIENTAAAISLPIVSTRFTDHTVRVKSGDTFVIGGLIRDDDVRDINKIPLLGDIPLFGNLFKHSVRTKQRTEVIVFITATVMNEEN